MASGVNTPHRECDYDLSPSLPSCSGARRVNCQYVCEKERERRSTAKRGVSIGDLYVAVIADVVSESDTARRQVEVCVGGGMCWRARVGMLPGHAGGEDVPLQLPSSVRQTIKPRPLYLRYLREETRNRLVQPQLQEDGEEEGWTSANPDLYPLSHLRLTSSRLHALLPRPKTANLHQQSRDAPFISLLIYLSVWPARAYQK